MPFCKTDLDRKDQLNKMSYKMRRITFHQPSGDVLKVSFTSCV